METECICLIENRAYKMEEDRLREILNMIKKKYKKDNKHAIYALRKGNTFDLQRQEFASIYKAQLKAEEYRKQGYVVYCV